MENHPDIVAAKAKLTLAEAELNGTRMEVARKVITLWNERNTQQRERLQAQRERAAVPGSVPSQNLIAAAARLAQSETELRYLTGQAVPGVARASVSTAAAKAPQMPRGAMVEKVREALKSLTELNFRNATFNDIIDYLKDKHRIEIQFDGPGLEEVGFATDKQMTINLKGIPLAAALQALEDGEPPLKFVVRDYGILVSTRDRAEQEGFFSALELARLDAGEEAAMPSSPSESAGVGERLRARKAEPPPKPSTGPK